MGHFWCDVQSASNVPPSRNGRGVDGVRVDHRMGPSGGPSNAREMRADWGETGPKLYANWRAPSPHGASETAILEQHEGVVGAP
jgi:hypothetical protein